MRPLTRTLIATASKNFLFRILFCQSPALKTSAIPPPFQQLSGCLQNINDIFILPRKEDRQPLMSIKHIPHKLTCQHPLLRLLPDRYTPPSLSFILNTTRQLLRHCLRIRNKRLMRPLHHIPFLSHSLNGSLTQAGPLNSGPSNPHPSRQT